MNLMTIRLLYEHIDEKILLKEKLGKYIDSRFQILYINSYEELK